jgi:outer membrane lipopolysaccharide assembly protein LptE/RlpB
VKRVRYGYFALLGALLLVCASCGYHTSGKAVRLPQNVRSIYVPTFTNNTHAFRVEQVLTAAVVQELRSRTNFQVVLSSNEAADAALNGTVTNVVTYPLTYDSQTGKASSSMLQVNMKVSLVDRSGKVLWENPNYSFRSQYELSQDAASFFEEESPALQRVARDFAQEMVSSIEEAY